MKKTRRTLLTGSGNQIVAHSFTPDISPKAVVVIAPAMAVHQSFYEPFAEYLARSGYMVWTFDYHGIGESWSGPLRNCLSDISTWISDNYDFVISVAYRESEGLPLFTVGHSLGGQIAPLLSFADKLSGLINISVGSGSTRHLQPKLKRIASFHWYVIVPVLCAIFGYFPGKIFSFIGNVPRNALYQWRQWCLTPEYLLSGQYGAREAYARAKFPVLGLTFLDDELLTGSGSKMMQEAFRDAVMDFRVIDPADFGMSQIGHFGFFKSSNGPDLWPMAASWIDSQVRKTASLPSNRDFK